ncbi:rCG31731 [Rattus norvegicus]|uniref:RCG31731 n=1 Tax=Rattus norvegicus TaxID=10116 RepID=A6JNE6_RAT|nr:rCG31731 [Rattus norvegicus]
MQGLWAAALQEGGSPPPFGTPQRPGFPPQHSLLQSPWLSSQPIRPGAAPLQYSSGVHDDDTVWIHTEHILLGLGYLTQDDILKFHSFAFKIHDVLVFNSCIVFQWVDVPHCLYAFFR